MAAFLETMHKTIKTHWSWAGFWLVWPASLLDWFPAVKGNDKKEILQVLFETFEGDNLGFTGSFLKREKEKKT